MNYLHLPLELGEFFFCLFHKQRTAPNIITITVRPMAVIIRGPKNAETEKRDRLSVMLVMRLPKLSQ